MRMQNGLRIRLCLFATCLAIVSNGWASDLRPWGEGKDYAQLEAVSAVNQHPVNFSAEQLTKLLGQFYKRAGNKEPAPYFSQDDIGRMAPELIRLFAKSKPNEDVDFGTSFNDSGLFLIPRKLNAGRLFVENGQLNLIIGMCAAEQDITYQPLYGKYRELNHGSRTKPVDKLGCELLAGNNMERVDNRTDWVRLNINAALTTNALPVRPPSSKALPLGAPASSVPETTSAPAQSLSTPTNPSEPANNAEGRLIQLKNLHDKGLITDAEYERKRAEIVKGL